MTQPKLPRELQPGKDLAGLASLCAREEQALMGLRFSGRSAHGRDLSGLEVRGCVLEGCSLQGCLLEGTALVDVVFQDCDLSNLCLREGFLERCRFASCKCVGADFSGGVLKDVAFAGGTLRYANLDRTRLTRVLLEETDLTEACEEQLLPHVPGRGGPQPLRVSGPNPLHAPRRAQRGKNCPPPGGGPHRTLGGCGGKLGCGGVANSGLRRRAQGVGKSPRQGAFARLPEPAA